MKKENSLKPSLKNLAQANSSVLALLLVALAFFLLSHFVSSARFSTVLHISAFLALAAMGQTLAFLLGGIDLSVASLLSASGILLCALISGSMPMIVCIIIVLAASAVIGLLNGLGIALLNIPPLVMTVAMQYILRGITLVTTNGKPIAPKNDALSVWANKSVIFGLSGGIIILLCCVVLLTLILYKTKLGREIYFLGSNPEIAKMSGIKTRKVTIICYSLAAMLAGLAGVMLVGYTGTAAVRIGDSYLLPSIAAVLIGGTSPLGGKGGVIRTVIGAFILSNIISLLTVMQMQEATRQIIEGGIVLLFIIINNVEFKKKVKIKATK